MVREVWKEDFAVEKAFEGDSRSFIIGKLKVLVCFLERKEFVIWYVSRKKTSRQQVCGAEILSKRMVKFRLFMQKKWISRSI